MKRCLIWLAALLPAPFYFIVTLSQAAEKKEQPKRVAIKAGRLINTQTGVVGRHVAG